MRRWWLAVLALTVAAAGGAVVWQQRPAPTAVAPVVAPSPEPVRTPLFSTGATAPAPTAVGLRRALAQALRDPGLGTLGLSVVDATTGRPVLELGASRPVTPASTAKIVTAVAALTVLAPDQRFATRLLQGSGGDLVLVGGGDPTLAGVNASSGYPVPARLAVLASKARGLAATRVVVDDSLFTGARTGPGWKPGYVSNGDVAPVSALAVDGGRTSTERNQPRAADPALEAGRQLAAALGVKAVVRGAAPAGAQELARVESPTVSQLVEAMLTRSDNDLAEALGRHVALATSLPPTFDGEVAAMLTTVGPLLDRAGVARSAIALRDASGLSPLSRLQPAALSRLLAVVGQDDRYAAVLTGLPVAGFDGTLAKRYRDSTAAGVVRAKTGTLNGVSALAGLARTRSGVLLAFDLTANGVPLSGTLQAQAALDRLATVLAACGCP